MNSALRLALLLLILGFLFPPPAFPRGEHGGAAPLETGFLGERAWLCSILVLDLETGESSTRSLEWGLDLVISSSLNELVGGA